MPRLQPYSMCCAPYKENFTMNCACGTEATMDTGSDDRPTIDNGRLCAGCGRFTCRHCTRSFLVAYCNHDSALCLSCNFPEARA